MSARQGGPLGCDVQYRAVIADRCRSGGDGVVRAEFDRFTSIRFNRTLNDISTGTVVLGPGCCDDLREARQGRELFLFADDEQVWRGELPADPRDCRNTASITAFDRWGTLQRRLIHEDLCFRPKCSDGTLAAGAPPLTIAEALIDDGYRGDDRCRDVTYLGGDQCQSPIEREYGEESAYTLDALKDLAKSQIDFTTHGDRQIVMCKDYVLGQTATLTCEHFAADVCADSGGVASATRVVVLGDGVKGTAGGSDPYYGLLETKVEDDSIKTTDAAVREARARLRALRPPIRWIDAPGGSTLTSEAPVSLNELVPGVLVPVQFDCACSPLSEVMRLTDVSVDYDSSGQKVGLTLVSINRVGDDGETVDGPEAEVPEDE